MKDKPTLSQKYRNKIKAQARQITSLLGKIKQQQDEILFLNKTIGEAMEATEKEILTMRVAKGACKIEMKKRNDINELKEIITNSANRINELTGGNVDFIIEARTSTMNDGVNQYYKLFVTETKQL